MWKCCESCSLSDRFGVSSYLGSKQAVGEELGRNDSSVPGDLSERDPPRAGRLEAHLQDVREAVRVEAQRLAVLHAQLPAGGVHSEASRIAYGWCSRSSRRIRAGLRVQRQLTSALGGAQLGTSARRTASSSPVRELLVESLVLVSAKPQKSPECYRIQERPAVCCQLQAVVRRRIRARFTRVRGTPRRSCGRLDHARMRRRNSDELLA